MHNSETRSSWGSGGPGSAAPKGAPDCDLVVSIINYRTAEMTIRCVETVLPALNGIDGHVALVDNFSDDGSVEKLQAWIDGLGPGAPVSLTASPTNTGFSGGHNIGIRARKGRFYLIFNSDAELKPDAAQALLDSAAANPRAGLIGSRLEYENGEVQVSCFRFPSVWSELIRAAGTGLVTKLLARHNVPLSIPPDPGQIDWVSFASVMARAEMIDQIGMMDEGYFLYSEDTEYSWRARQAGWGVVYEPRARAIHHRGGSAPVKAQAAAKKRVPAYFYASRSRFMATAHGRAGLIAANLAWHLGRGVAMLRILMGSKNHRTVAHEAYDIWTNALDPFGDRRQPRS
jgi:N-acetylglucosaminyl-diphospho-decaprenol L-rhamnosyltransferase